MPVGCRRKTAMHSRMLSRMVTPQRQFIGMILRGRSAVPMKCRAVLLIALLLLAADTVYEACSVLHVHIRDVEAAHRGR